MTYIYYIFRSVAVSLISVLELMMLVRAVMSWFPQTQGGRLHQALVFFTEPIIMPFRALLSRIPALRAAKNNLRPVLERHSSLRNDHTLLPFAKFPAEAILPGICFRFLPCRPSGGW